MSGSYLKLLQKTATLAGSSTVETPAQLTPPKKPEKTDPNLESKSLWYPSDLWTAGNNPYILFAVREPVARGGGLKRTLALYMPPNIKVNYGVEYNSLELPLEQRLSLATDIKDAVMGKGVEGTWANMGMGLVGNLADTFISSYNIGKQIQLEYGRTVNPHMALTFDGVKFRNFGFDFKLMARTPEESEDIRQLIKSFKLAMFPAEGDTGKTRYWLYPDNFDIYLLTPSNQYMFHILTSVLTSCDISYTGTGTGVPSFFGETGAPVALTMSLQFQELELLTKERIMANY